MTSTVRALMLSLALAAIVPALAQAQHAPTEEQRARAAEHFDRGIAFFNEERYDAALAEFSRAHELAPAHQTLYNLARVHAALGHAVEAARAYEQYLREAGDAIDERRRREAENALEEQRARIGRLMVHTDVEGARVAIDGVDVATTPLASPIELSAGSHTVEVRAPGRETVRRAVAIAGQEEVSIEVALREEIIPRGTLRVTTSVPEVAIEVGGEPVGLTPLPSTVPLRAGEHIVTATRRGYRTESQRVLIEDGAEAEVHFEMRRDPDAPPDDIGRVRIELPDAPYVIRVDGEPMIGFDLELPVGPHTIELEVTDREPYQGSLRVPASGRIRIVPPLSWTLDARRRRLEGAATQRVLGASFTVAAGLLLAGGLPVLIWNEIEITHTDEELQRDQERYDRLEGVGCRMLDDRRCTTLRERAEWLSEYQADQNVIRAVAATAVIAGALLGAVGIPLWASAPSDDEVDASARARTTLRLGPGVLELSGSF